MDEKVMGIMQMLQLQRNTALDAVAEMNGKMATLEKEIADLKAKLEEKAEVKPT